MSFPFLASQPEPQRDPVTGLPDATALAQCLEGSLAGAAGDGEERRRQPDFLVLLEIYPQARDAQRALAAIQRAGGCLHALFGSSAQLFSLGLGVFALVWPRLAPEEARRLADVLLRRLQREKFSRAHIGLAALDGRRQNGPPAPGAEIAAADTTTAAEPQSLSQSLLTEAWQALAVARRRGPFCLCLAGSQPLFPPPAPGERAKLGRLWRGREHFALLLIRQDQPALSNHFSKRVRGALMPDTAALFLNQREVLIYLDQADQQQALAWLADFRRRMGQSKGAGFSAGVALYPCLELPKAGIPGNCRKALLHAELLGPEATAVFDAITLNISGDAYYNAGDIRMAVAEYRRGLELDPANVNLLNSLGVALAQLKQSRPAMAAFEQALAVEPDNFMALYNLGFALLAAGREDEALGCLERAWAVNGHPFELALQLGQLYHRRGRHREVVDLLQHCIEQPGMEECRDGDLATARRLLAQALAAVGEHKAAEQSVQQVLAHNPRDPEALSLLGELYLQNGEGAAIALSLCRQAVELAGEDGDHWRRLGWVQWQQGEPAAAESLQRALALNRRDLQAATWLAEIYRQQGKNTQAKRLRARCGAAERLLN